MSQFLFGPSSTRAQGDPGYPKTLMDFHGAFVLYKVACNEAQRERGWQTHFVNTWFLSATHCHPPGVRASCRSRYETQDLSVRMSTCIFYRHAKRISSY